MDSKKNNTAGTAIPNGANENVHRNYITRFAAKQMLEAILTANTDDTRKYTYGFNMHPLYGCISISVDTYVSEFRKKKDSLKNGETGYIGSHYIFDMKDYSKVLARIIEDRYCVDTVHLERPVNDMMVKYGIEADNAEG